MATTLKAREIERLENTSFATALVPAPGPSVMDITCEHTLCSHTISVEVSFFRENVYPVTDPALGGTPVNDAVHQVGDGFDGAAQPIKDGVNEQLQMVNRDVVKRLVEALPGLPVDVPLP